MSLALAILLFFSLDPIPKNDTENKSIAVMDVILEVLPGTLLVDQFTQNVKATSPNSNYQIGFKEYIITYPCETEVITADVNNHCADGGNCSSYMVTNIEKIDDHSSKVRIHYLVGEKEKSGKTTSRDKHTTTIIYL